MVVSKVRRIAEAQGLTISALAARTGIAYGTARSLWLEHTVRVDFDTLVKLCCGLKVGVGDLFEVVCAE
jgi:DNA-binding Xre family transcriptional regulator